MTCLIYRNKYKLNSGMLYQLIHLHSQNTSLVIKARQGIPEMIYWGKSLPKNCDLTPLLSSLNRPVPQGRIDTDTVLSLCPEHARGLFTSPGLEGCRNGMQLICGEKITR